MKRSCHRSALVSSYHIRSGDGLSLSDLEPIEINSIFRRLTAEEKGLLRSDYFGQFSDSAHCERDMGKYFRRASWICAAETFKIFSLSAARSFGVSESAQYSANLLAKLACVAEEKRQDFQWNTA
jgi:hypothetical protein